VDLRDSADATEYRRKLRALLDDQLPAGWKGFGALPEQERADFLVTWRAFLIEHRLLALHWPQEFGGAGLSPLEQAIIHEEFTLAGLPPMLSDNDAFGFQMLGNTLLAFGTQEQKARFLPRIRSGEDLWCQGFSEPDAGSDLAAIRTKARLDGDEWVIDGQKIWTSAGHLANWMFVLVRTNPDADRHRGLTMLLLPLDQPGVDVRPIRQINGSFEFNEVFLDGARTPVENVVGEVDGGWGVAMALLGFERGENATAMSLRFEHDFERLADLVRDTGRGNDPAVRQRLAEAYLRLRVLRLLATRSLTSFLRGSAPGPDAAILKLYWSEHWQEVADLAVDVLGDAAVAPSAHRPHNADGPDFTGAPNDSGSWVGTWLNASAATIYAGSSEVQRNIIGERVLGLPK
jgi:alkylation response protein AidB-like acyl-CoA dehydrogenase